MLTVKYRFRTPCPAICHQTRPTEVINWVHADCGGEMYVRSDAYLECSKGHSHRMIDWKFKCSEHDYKEASLDGYIYALYILAQAGTPQELIRAVNAKLLLRL